MAPLFIEAILLVLAAITFFVELVVAGPRRVNLIALGLLLVTLALLVPPVNGMLTR